MPVEDADRKTIAQAVRAYIARERISREEFAERTRLGKSTVDKLVVGLFSEKTVLQIESQLGIDLRRSDADADIADEELGRYARNDVQRYAGDYIFARPSFQEDAAINAFHMQVEWDRAKRCLSIKERTRGKKVLQFGKISIPRASRHIFILSNQGGWLGTAILSDLDVYKRMKGVMLTMGRALGNLYMPMAMPVVMNKYDRIEDHMAGTLAPGSRFYEVYREDLAAVEPKQFARWISIKPK